MNKSIATLDNPEFINLQTLDINPLMSSCEIKVCYVGENRNGSFLSKENLTEYSKTLRGCPIVGYYKPEKEDFADHGQVITIDDEGIKFSCKTFPYGFVAPDAKVWFQKFEDTDEFGNTEVRDYLMTTGYLWTGQYPEANSVIESGKGQSMEFDENSFDGHWAINKKTGMEFFIITDAIFSKLCILGDDVEPCFEGASVTAPNISKNFSLDQEFKNTLFSMMNDLKQIFQGGQTMEDDTMITEPAANGTFVKEDEEDKATTVNTTKQDGEEGQTQPVKDDEEDKKTECTRTEEEYTLLQNQYNELNDKYSALEQSFAESKQNYSNLEAQVTALTTENETLKAFKLAKENEAKDQMIASFYMLSDEDKADIIANKEKYSLDDIESKLSVICVRKRVNFEKDIDTNHNVSTTFSLNSCTDTAPAWVQACDATKNRRK